MDQLFSIVRNGAHCCYFPFTELIRFTLFAHDTSTLSRISLNCQAGIPGVLVTILVVCNEVVAHLPTPTPVQKLHCLHPVQMNNDGA